MTILYCCSKKICPLIRLRSAKNVVDEIEMLVKKYGAREIHIWDDCFTISKKRAIEICNLIKDRKLRIKIAFPNGVRADMVSYELLKSLKEALFSSVFFRNIKRLVCLSKTPNSSAPFCTKSVSIFPFIAAGTISEI